MKKIKLFDTHSHLHSDFFKDDVEDILSKMKEESVWTISVGVSLDDSKKAVKMSENDNIYSSVGIHPTEKEIFKPEEFQKLINNNKKIVAVGECGLDYHWPKKDLEVGKINKEEFEEEIQRQKILFERQINFALKNKLPLMLHIRSFKNSNAHWDAFEILDRKQLESEEDVRANFHFFTESPEIVDEVIKRNFMISLPGVITFAKLDETVRKIPLENLMSETDSPFAAPKPYRGKTNTPIYVEEVVKKIAEVKEKSFDEVNEILIENAKKFWRI